MILTWKHRRTRRTCPSHSVYHKRHINQPRIARGPPHRPWHGLLSQCYVPTFFIPSPMVPNTVTAPDETTDGLPRNNGTLCGNRPVGRSVRLPSVAQLPEHQRSFTVYCALTPCIGDLEKTKAVRLQVFMTATMKDTLL